MTEPWLRNVWYAAIWSADLPPGEIVPRTILGTRLALFRTAGGRPAVLEDRCPHRFAPLHRGKLLDDGNVQCGYHGLEFNAAGTCVLNPHGDGKIPAGATIRSFTVSEKHTMIWIWMGDAPADESRIPDYSIFDDAPPAHVLERGTIEIAADYRLITDNLLDLSHASYLHPGSLGNVEMASVTETEVSIEGQSVRVHRLSPSVPIPGTQALMFGKPTELVDKWNTIVWRPPGNMILENGACDPGADPKTGTGYHGVHLLTPETENTTHYLFSAVRFNVRESDPVLTEQIRERLSVIRRRAFEAEDEPMIREQAAIVAELGDAAPRQTLLAIDAGAARFRRILDDLIKQEAG
jgi:phenylpropionate dioxygenase-like ring-hydroxylating dioxygenase large terminal subunit